MAHRRDVPPAGSSGTPAVRPRADQPGGRRPAPGPPPEAFHDMPLRAVAGQPFPPGSRARGPARREAARTTARRGVGPARHAAGADAAAVGAGRMGPAAPGGRHQLSAAARAPVRRRREGRSQKAELVCG